MKIPAAALAVVALLAVTDGSLAVRAVVLRARLEGKSLVGTRLPLLGLAVGGCTVFHYSSSLCGYCVPPRSAGWLKLEADLARAGCRSVVIAPNGSDFPLDGDTTPHRLLTTVPLPFAAATRFAATPTTAVIAAEGVVVWMQVGASAASDAPAALRNLAVYRRAGRAGLWAEWLLQR